MGKRSSLPRTSGVTDRLKAIRKKVEYMLKTSIVSSLRTELTLTYRPPQFAQSEFFCASFATRTVAGCSWRRSRVCSLTPENTQVMESVVFFVSSCTGPQQLQLKARSLKMDGWNGFPSSAHALIDQRCRNKKKDESNPKSVIKKKKIHFH